MRFHCLGAGSIGSLIASNLAQLPTSKVRLVFRKKDLVGAILSRVETHAAKYMKTTRAPLVSLTIENSGLPFRTDGLEVEVTPSEEDKIDAGRLIKLGSGKGIGAQSSKFDNLIKYDPIESLVITTKSPSVLAGIKPLLPRLSSKSTVVLCHNGMGVLERLLDSYWPDDSSSINESNSALSEYRGTSRPSFICAITTHGVWRKDYGHYVHAGVGDIKFAVVPNRAALASIASTPSPSWGDHFNNPLLNSRSLIIPTLEHIPLTPETESLHNTISAFLKIKLNGQWLPLPTFQIAQLQKLAVNSSINSLTAVLGVNNGALLGSPLAKSLISSISTECSNVFAAHLARESGTWSPPPIPTSTFDNNSDSRAIESAISSSSYSLSSTPVPHPSPPPLPTSHPLSPSSLLDYTLRIIFSTSVNLSSTLQDILSTTKTLSNNLKSRTEVDFIHGYIVALGRRYNIDTTSIETMGKLVRLKEEMMRSGAVDRVLERQIKELNLNNSRNDGTNSRCNSLTSNGNSKKIYSPVIRNKGIDSDTLGEGVKRFERAQKISKEKNKRIQSRVAIESKKRSDSNNIS